MPSWTYEVVGRSDVLDFYVRAILAALCCGVFFFWLPGRVLVRFAVRRGWLDQRQLLADEAGGFIPLLVGLAFFPVVGLALGLAHVFTPPVLAAFAVLMIVCEFLLSRKTAMPRKRPAARTIAGLIRTLRSQDPFILVVCAAGILCVGHIAVSQPTAWFDDNFSIAGGHLSRTGGYLLSWSRGREAMAVMMALTGIFFPQSSALVPMIGWGPFYPVLLVCGTVFLVRELAGRKWETFGALVIIFPLFMRIFEIRSSVSGFTLMIWALYFSARHARLRETSSLLGAVAALGASWMYGQVGTMFGVLTIGIFSVQQFVGGARKPALALMRILGWTAVFIAVPAAFTMLSIALEKGGLTPARVAMNILPLALAVAAPWILRAAMTRLPPLKAPALVFPAIAGAMLAGAFAVNPPWAPRYTWYNFNAPVDFLELNFISYGLPGLLYGVSIVVVLVMLARRKATDGMAVLCAGVMAALVPQLLSPFLLWLGVDVPAGRAQIWNFWKDAIYYFTNVLAVVGIALAVSCAAKRSRRFAAWFSPWKLRLTVTLSAMICLEPFVFMPSFWSGVGSVEDFFARQVSGRFSYFPEKAQQVFSIPNYISYGNTQMTVMRRTGCGTCGFHIYGGQMKYVKLIDFLSSARTRPNETMVLAHSVLTAELFMDRRVRYSNGPDTVDPVYVYYVGGATAHEFYWQSMSRIRRDASGMAYTVVDPRRNLVFLGLRPSVSSVALRSSFNVPYDGRFELMAGGENWRLDADVRLDGVLLGGAPDTYGVDLGMLKAGRQYGIEIVPRDGKVAPADLQAIVHPWRFWRLEEKVLAKSDKFFAIWLMRFTGMPSAEMTVEDMMRMFEGSGAQDMLAMIKKYNVRFMILEDALRAAFPGAEKMLDAQAFLESRTLDGVKVYEVKGAI